MSVSDDHSLKAQCLAKFCELESLLVIIEVGLHCDFPAANSGAHQ
jgi:hypothetical protein